MAIQMTIPVLTIHWVRLLNYKLQKIFTSNDVKWNSDIYGDPKKPDSLEELTRWEPFNKNQGRLLIRNDDVIPQHKGRKIEMENHYMHDICEMWGDVDVYLKIWIKTFR